MYAIRIPGETSLRTNDPLRTFAQLEYRHDSTLWLRAAARDAVARPILPRRARTAPRLPRLRALFARAAAPSHRPVAHKGSPRLDPDGGPHPA